MNERATTIGLAKGRPATAGVPADAAAAPGRDVGVDRAGPSTIPAGSAGDLIRAARQAQGLHIAALAAAIKVSQHKLELLEADRIEELPDATFARALAQTVCRFLKIDPQPVLAQLPQLGGHRLDHLSEGINTPFRDRPGHREPGDWSVLASPAVWAPALLVVAALALYLAPAGWLGGWPEAASRWASDATAPDAAVPSAASPGASGASLSESSLPGPATSAGGASAATGAVPEGNAVVQTVHSAPPSALAQAGGASATARGAGAAVEAASPTLQLRANAESWVEVVDARAQVLLSRMLQPGETVSLEGSMPLKLKVGNAAGTEAVFRGQVIDLAGTTRDNVARLELK